jgi:hypothetical protein
MDMSETQALFEGSFQDVDLDGMSDIYLHHEEPSVDDNCLKEILDSAEFAELFGLTEKENDTIMSTSDENPPSARVESASPSNEPKPTPKTRNSMSIEELFLSNRERVLELVAAQNDEEQQEGQSGSFEDLTILPKKMDEEALKEGLDESISRLFPDYIPDMLLFFATDPNVEMFDVFDKKVTAISCQAFVNEINTPPLSDDCLDQPTGHYDGVPFGHLDLRRADSTVHQEKVYRAEGIDLVFNELKSPGNDIIVDQVTLETPRVPTKGTYSLNI